MDVQNIQLGACLVVDSFPADWLIIRVELRRRDDYDDAVRRLKDRYQIACALQPGFPPVRDAPRLRHLRYFPVTTARGVAEVREAHPASEDWWTSFEAALRPLQLILCLAQRRSINFVHHVARRRRSPDYALSPNLRAANYAGAFVKDTGRFVNQALVQYAGQVCSDNPPWRVFETASG